MRIRYAFLFLSIILLSRGAFSQTFEYVNLFERDHTVIIRLSPPMFAGGDRGTEVKFCHRGDSFVCVQSPDFNFAVPIVGKSLPTEWEHKGYLYKRGRRETMRLLGERFEGWIVESTQNDIYFRYLYSFERGLMAFSVKIDGKTHDLVVQNAIGFGSQRPR